jgi:hypothetical protein
MYNRQTKTHTKKKVREEKENKTITTRTTAITFACLFTYKLEEKKKIINIKHCS